MRPRDVRAAVDTRRLRRGKTASPMMAAPRLPLACSDVETTAARPDGQRAGLAVRARPKHTRPTRALDGVWDRRDRLQDEGEGHHSRRVQVRLTTGDIASNFEVVTDPWPDSRSTAAARRIACSRRTPRYETRSASTTCSGPTARESLQIQDQRPSQTLARHQAGSWNFVDTSGHHRSPRDDPISMRACATLKTSGARSWGSDFASV